jgi:hypothetical protein
MDVVVFLNESFSDTLETQTLFQCRQLYKLNILECDDKNISEKFGRM